MGIILFPFLLVLDVFASFPEGAHCERLYLELPETDPRRAYIQAASVFGEIGCGQTFDQRVQINNGNITRYSRYIGMKNRPKGEKERLQSGIQNLENENRAIKSFYKPLFDRVFLKRSIYEIPIQFCDNQQYYMMKLVEYMFSWSDRLCKNGQLQSEEALKLQIEQDLIAFFDAMDTEIEKRKKVFKEQMLKIGVPPSEIQSVIDGRNRWLDDVHKSETLDLFKQVISKQPVVQIGSPMKSLNSGNSSNSGKVEKAF